MSYLRISLVALATFTFVSTANASAPAGVWARVDQVTFDPNAKAPTMRVDGVFMVANQKPDFPAYPGYSVPQYGYMFYNCPVAKELPMCLMQWTELQKVAATPDNCRGWGDNSLPANGSVRPANDPEAKPDAYPIALGVTPGFSPCEAIKTWQLDNPPPDDPPPDTTSTSGSSTGDLSSSSGDPGTTSTTSTTGSTSGDPGSTGTPGSTGNPGSTSGAEASGDPVSTGPTEGSTGATSNATGSSTSAGTDGQTEDKGGCACNSGAAGDPTTTALALLGGLGLLRRRRA